MSKINKIIAIIIMSIIIVLGIEGISSANYELPSFKTTSKDDYNQVKLDYQAYLKNPNILCIAKGQSLNSSWNGGTRTYDVINKIHIEGFDATGYVWSKTEKKYVKKTFEKMGTNAKLAAVINYGEYYTGVKKRTEEDGAQMALWWYLDNWMDNVGNKFANLSKDLLMNYNAGDDKVGNVSGSKVDDKLIKKVDDYVAKQRENINPKDNTNYDNLKYKTETISGQEYVVVGPYKWEFSGTISSINILDQDKKAISGVKLGQYSGTKLKEVQAKNIKSGKSFYLLIPYGKKNITKIEAEATIENEVLEADIVFLKTKGHTYQNLCVVDGKTGSKELNLKTKQVDISAKLQIVKTSEIGNIPLSNVPFAIQRKEDGKFVKIDSKGAVVSYVDIDGGIKNKNVPTVSTKEDGKINITKLMPGTYVVYEKEGQGNANYIVATDGKEIKVTVKKDKSYNVLSLVNTPANTKISGYVWLDKLAGKDQASSLSRDNIYNSEIDELKSGVTVTLKMNAEGLKAYPNFKETTTTTNTQGKYEFKEVPIGQLKYLYVEFTYNGLKYQNVTQNLDKDNGSKAIESTTDREKLNEGFNVITGTGLDTGARTSSSGTTVQDLNYSITNSNNAKQKAELINDESSYPIVANTLQTKINLEDKCGKNGVENINLGIYERIQPELYALDDITNAKVGINGYTYTYSNKYDLRYNRIENARQDAENKGEKFNVDVLFGRDEGGYSQGIYNSDVNYKADDKSKELQVYITYRINLGSSTTPKRTVDGRTIVPEITSKINSITNYYDSRYEIAKIGRGLNEDGTIKNEIKIPNSTDVGNGYKKVTIDNLGVTLKPGKSTTADEDIFVQFKLTREAVKEILDNSKGTLKDNVIEITSYSTTGEDGKAYAGIDKVSNPNNLQKVDDKTTYEMDTDYAPTLKLQYNGVRTLEGKVFEDNAIVSGEGNVREGNGQYDAEEGKVEGVKVTLIDAETGAEIKLPSVEGQEGDYVSSTTTNSEGDYTIKGFIPGKYQVKYEWGKDNGGKDVRTYKSTVRKGTYSDDKWYLTTDPRYSDALDKWETRLNIDKYTQTGQGEEISIMDAYTNTMDFGIETTSNTNQYQFNVKNVDFGLIERAKQDIGLEKHIKNIKVTIVNGPDIVDATVNDNGELEGEITNLTKPVGADYIRLEIAEQDMAQGANLEIGYKIKVTNNSELDYATENYYNNGKDAINADDESKLLKLKVTDLKDYLDDKLVNTSAQWDKGTIEENDEFYKQNRTLYSIKDFEDSLSPIKSDKNSISVDLKASRQIAPTEEELTFNNTVILKKYKITPEDPAFGPPIGGIKEASAEGEYQYKADAEEFSITGTTGRDKNYVLPIMIGISTLAILGAGIVLIKKKVIK